jgi:hypothetical protein
MGALCLALVLAGLTLPTPAWAAAESSNFRGSSAIADFSSTDPSGCILTSAFVFGTDGRLHEPPGPPVTSPTVQVNLFQFDSCTGTTLVFAYGLVTIPDEAFQIDQQLTSATLNATVQATDLNTGSTLNVDIDVTWTGTGELTRQSIHSHFHAPGFISHTRFNGTFREAQASGSISFAGTSLAGQSTSALIGSTKSGSVVID